MSMAIKVRVFINQQAHQSGKWCFERIIDHDDSLNFDAISITKTLRMLYGSKSVVELSFL